MERELNKEPDRCKCDCLENEQCVHKKWSDLADEAKQRLDGGDQIDADTDEQLRKHAGA